MHKNRLGDGMSNTYNYTSWGVSVLLQAANELH